MKKESTKVLEEIVKLYPFLEKSEIKDANDDKLQKLSKQLNEPRFLSYKIKRQLEEMELKEQRRKFLANKK